MRLVKVTYTARLIMRLTFLGTGASHGVPMIACPCGVCASADTRNKRLRSSALLHTDNGQTILIDAGPDFRCQMLRSQTTRLSAILLTHEHKDHTGGLDDIRAFNAFMRRPIPVYALKTTLAAVRRDYAYAFAKKKYEGMPEMTLHPIASAPFSINGTSVTPIAGLHNAMPVTGFRIGGTAYITDMNCLPPASVRRIAGCHTLVINALRQTPHPAHFSLGDALQIIREAKPAQAYLTHISHKLGLHEDVQKTLPPNVFLAYDGLTIEGIG